MNIRNLLGDRGISGALLEAERAHPYLFFTAEDVPRLREMARREPYRTCAEGIVRAARLTLKNPIPDEPSSGAADSRLPDGSYDESFLKATYDFLSYAYAMQYYGPLYAFAYLLTEEEVFARRAKAWALAYAGWENWGPAADPWDMEAAMILSGAVIVYDWIPDRFSRAEREAFLAGLREKGRKLCEKDAYWLTQDPAARRGSLANNHRWRSIPLEGLAGLGLLYEVEEARDWLDMGLVLTRDYLLPAAYGRDGERMEGRGWLGVCLSDGGRFMEALVRNGGPDLFDTGPLRRLSHFLIFGMEMYRSRGHYNDRAGLLAHARRLRDPALQWLALKHDLRPDTKGYPAYWYDRDKVFYQPETPYTVSLRWNAGTGGMQIEVNGVVRDRQDVERVEGIDGVTLQVEGDRVEIVSLEVFDAAGGVVDRLDGPVTLTDERGETTLGFANLRAGEIRASLRKYRSDAGQAMLMLTSGGRRVRGVAFTDEHEIAKAVEEKDGTYTLGVAAAKGLYFHGPWEFLFYDGSLAPAAPKRDVTGFHFRDLGLVKFTDTLHAEGVHVTFTSGPEVSKEQGDKNAFTLSAFGERLLAPLRTPKTGEATLTQAQYDLTAWYQGTSGRNTILVDGRGQPTVHEESPVPREYELQWLGREDVAKSGRIEETFFSSDYDYVRGEAAHAYRPLLETYRRHLMFLKPQGDPDLRYLVLFDEIETAGKRPRRIEWRLLSPYGKVTAAGGTSRIEGHAAWMHIRHLWPETSAVRIDSTPAPRDADRQPYLRFPSPGPVESVHYLHLLQPLRSAEAEPFSATRVMGHGGIGIRVDGPDGTALAVFRTGDEAVSAGGLTTDALASLVRRGPDGGGSVVLHGGTFAELDGRRVFSSADQTSVRVELPVE
ncbi:MAG: heparinase II/III family protein [Gemmatimonadota bacterium]|nr:heparinase II/III family protein [Gemmatimonadota bacterium]